MFDLQEWHAIHLVVYFFLFYVRMFELPKVLKQFQG